MKREFLEKAAKEYYEYIAHRYLWFNRLVVFSGMDNLETIIARLVHLFPDEQVPDQQWFVDTCTEYLADPDEFLHGEEENPDQYSDWWEENSPMIDEINAFLNVKEPKSLLLYTRAFNVWMYELIKAPASDEFNNWFQNFIKKVGFTPREAKTEQRRHSALLLEEARISREIEERMQIANIQR